MTSVHHSSALPPHIAAFLQRFYLISDTESAHEEYAFNCFTSPTAFQIGPMQPVCSNEDILQWRKSGWEKVEKRRHVVEDVYVHPDAAEDTSTAQIMLYGFVEYDLRDGSKGKASWGGRMALSGLDNEGDIRISNYKVWITPQ